MKQKGYALTGRQYAQKYMRKHIAVRDNIFYHSLLSMSVAKHARKLKLNKIMFSRKSFIYFVKKFDGKFWMQNI